MRIVQEMYARGIEFVPIDLRLVNPTKFTITDGKIMPSLTSIQGLGEKAAESITQAIKNGHLSSVSELKRNSGIGDSTVNLLDKFGLLCGIPRDNQLSLFDLLDGGGF